MASPEGDQLLAGAFHAIIDKVEADILQIEKKWNWKLMFIHQGYFLRKIPAINVNFAPKYMQLRPSTLVFEVWEKYKDVPSKILKLHAKTNSS